jgi:hypothetical protein
VSLPSTKGGSLAQGWQSWLQDARWRAVVRTHWGALAVGALFFALTLTYNAAVPLWESDNEWAHYQYIRYIVTERRLPAAETPIALAPTADQCSLASVDGLSSVHQFRQPPLYYLLGALTLAGSDLAADLPVALNPHVHTSHSQGGLNVAVHGDAERFPYQGTALAVHRVRLLSGLIGLAGLAAVYLSGLLLFPTRRYLALAMLAVNAFIPQYIFSASVVNNDILAAALGAWCIYFCLRYLHGQQRPLTLLLAVLAAGLGIVAKYTALVLTPIVAMTIVLGLVAAWRRDRPGFARHLGQTLLMLGLASAPLLLWLVRNRRLYGHLLASYADVTTVFVTETLGASPTAGSGLLQEALYATRFVLMTLWGLFGNDNIALPTALIVLLQGVFVVSLIGVFWTLAQRRQPAELRVAIAAALLALAAAWLINFIKAAGSAEPRGRYFLPIYAVISFLLVLGIDRVLPARWRIKGAALLPCLLLVVSAALPLALLRPAYAAPAVGMEAALRPGEQPINAVFGDFAELLGYRIEPQRLGLYETAEVTLVWRALRETPNNYTVGVHLLDGANNSLDRQTRFPGGGNRATSLWRTGEVFRDSYRVGLGLDARGSLPSLGRIKVAMYCYAPEGDRPLPVTDQAGHSLGDAVTFGRLRLAEVDAAQPPVAPALYTFGDELALEQFSFAPQAFPLGAEVVIDTQWRALRPPLHDYTLFAHLVNAQGETAAGFDIPLTDGYYPSGLWDAGELVQHLHRLPVMGVLLTSDMTLQMGLYDPASGARLPVFDARGARQPNDVVVLGVYAGLNHFNFLPVVVHSDAPADGP